MARLTEQERDKLVRAIVGAAKDEEVPHIIKDLNRRVVKGDYHSLDPSTVFQVLAALKQRQQQLGKERSLYGPTPDQEREEEIERLMRTAPGTSRDVADCYVKRRSPAEVMRKDIRRAPEPEPAEERQPIQKEQPDLRDRLKSWNSSSK